MIAILGGSLLPGAVALAVPNLDGGAGHWERVITVAAVVTIGGALLGALSVLLYEWADGIWRAGLLHSLVVFRSRWRPPPTWTGIPIGIVLALAWLTTSATWRPRVTIEFFGSPENAPDLPVASSRYPAGESSNDPTPDIALTTGGTLLAACGYYPDAFRRINGGGASQQLQLWETTWPWPRHAGSRDLERYVRDCDFSLDGQRLAITHSDTVALWNTLTGEELQVIHPPWAETIPASHDWLSGARFTNDGGVLIARGWNSATSDASLYAWDAKSLELVRQDSFAGFQALQLNHSYTQFARVGFAINRTPADALELVDAKTGEVRQRHYNAEPREQSIFSPDDKLLAHGRRLWDLSKGTERVFPGPIKQFVSNGRRVVVIRNQAPTYGKYLEWASWLPIVRHCVPRPGVWSRLLLFDSQTGKLIVASQSQDRIEAVTVSRNGRVVATATRKGRIRIWDVPE